jgi:hypothetical protein
MSDGALQIGDLLAHCRLHGAERVRLASQVPSCAVRRTPAPTHRMAIPLLAGALISTQPRTTRAPGRNASRIL